MQELTNQELMKLETMQGPEEAKEIFPGKKFETKLMADWLGFIEKALAIVENQDPNVERFSKVAMGVRDSFQCYRIIYDEKKKKTVQAFLNQFFSKRSDPQENVKSVENQCFPPRCLLRQTLPPTAPDRCNSIIYHTVRCIFM